jgi:regulator of replication initiation timing
MSDSVERIDIDASILSVIACLESRRSKAMREVLDLRDQLSELLKERATMLDENLRLRDELSGRVADVTESEGIP